MMNIENLEIIGLIRQDTVQIYIGTDTVTYETQEEQYR